MLTGSPQIPVLESVRHSWRMSSEGLEASIRPFLSASRSKLRIVSRCSGAHIPISFAASFFSKSSGPGIRVCLILL